MIGAPNGVHDVGIHAIQLYFPKNVVNQTELEKFDNVSTGKYTTGLGQKQMGFCADHEDVVSIAMTVTKQLMEEYTINPSTIGFLAVGTETLIDKSKSVKTELMQLFGENYDIEGVDVKNACFGGTQAVFHAVDWVQANYDLDGRLAMAVLADIAVYEAGSARCTGGAGAIAVLIGPNAPIVFERGLRACHMTSTWDFYKPICHVVSEYPKVFGSNSLSSYMSSLDGCYRTYMKKVKKLHNEDISLSSFSAAMFHSPYTKLVQKGVGRLNFIDYEAGNIRNNASKNLLDELRSCCNFSLDDRHVMKLLLTASKGQWERLTDSFLEMNRRIGNMYTPSLFLQLVCWLGQSAPCEEFHRILMFAYGSGSAAAMFSVKVTPDESLLSQMRRVSRAAFERLDQRIIMTPERYTQVMGMREKFLQQEASEDSTLSVPKALENHSEDLQLFPGTFYLKSLDPDYRRSYGRTESAVVNGATNGITYSEFSNGNGCERRIKNESAKTEFRDGFHPKDDCGTIAKEVVVRVYLVSSRFT